MRRLTTLIATAAIVTGGSAAALAHSSARADSAESAAATPAVSAQPAAEPAGAPARGPQWAQARLRSNSGTYVGTATFRDRGGATEIRVNLKWIKPGFHGLHLHTVGKCELNSLDPADATKRGAYLSAGGHLAGSGAEHPSHAGDLPTVLALKNTRVQATFLTDRVTVADLFDKDGTSIVLHQGVDNYANIPTRYAAGGADAETAKAGDAGSRAACGVIRR